MEILVSEDSWRGKKLFVRERLAAGRNWDWNFEDSEPVPISSGRAQIKEPK